MGFIRSGLLRARVKRVSTNRYALVVDDQLSCGKGSVLLNRSMISRFIVRQHGEEAVAQTSSARCIFMTGDAKMDVSRHPANHGAAAEMRIMALPSFAPRIKFSRPSKPVLRLSARFRAEELLWRLKRCTGRTLSHPPLQNGAWRIGNAGQPLTQIR